MGFRFRKTIKIAPGVRLNLGKSGISTSVGKRGASVTVGRRGAHANVGIPGTGLSYRTRLNEGSQRGLSNGGRVRTGLTTVVALAVLMVLFLLLLG
jgi:hypothetical protein